jgi:hypothetical protein
MIGCGWIIKVGQRLIGEQACVVEGRGVWQCQPVAALMSEASSATTCMAI